MADEEIITVDAGPNQISRSVDVRASARELFAMIVPVRTRPAVPGRPCAHRSLIASLL